MSHNFWILLTLLSIASLCKALPNLHKLMTPHQLQSVFQVDKAADVPHYEIVQLLHQSNEEASTFNYRKRRSINTAAASAPTSNLVAPKESHHVKKDLSKNPYYSELKATAAAGSTGDKPNGNALLNSVNANPPPPVHSDLSKLVAHNVTFEAFGLQHNLKLRKTEGLFKGAPHLLRMWTVNEEKNATNGLDLQEVLDRHHNSEEVGHIFQDEENLAAILMRRHKETGDLIMEGSIGHEIVIKPLPHDLSPNKDQAHHVIYKREPAQMDHFSDFAFMEPDDLASSEKLEKLQQQRRQRRSANLDDLTADETEAIEDEVEADDELATSETRNRARRQAPYMIYPEILVIVDYDGYRLHGGDNLQVKRYFISFWNGVDLRYRLLKGPRIRISIAGIIISRGRDATPYLERNRVGRDAIDSAAALTDMGKYLFRERRLPVYDIAVAITKLDMCRRTTAYGECNRGTAGFAYVGGACVVNKRLEKVNSVAIIEDTGGFSGIIVAAHEVGHLLGAVHDGSPPPSYLGGPGAQRCRWEDGYIMSDLRHTERGFRWSPCTVQSFHHFLNGDTATCLHNQPHEDSALGRSLPGTLLSLDAQCRRDRGTYACFKDERVCAQLFCFDAQTGYCVAYRPAAEGSSCGNGLHCLDGRCTPLPTNNIAYGSQYRLAYKNDEETQNENSSEEMDDDEGDDDEASNDEEDSADNEAAEMEDDNNNSEKDNDNGDKTYDNSKNNDDDDETRNDNNDTNTNDDDDDDDDDDENALQNLQKNDNSVEETSLEVNDELDHIRNNIKKTTTTTTNKPTIIQQQKQQQQNQLNAIEYLKYLLQNKSQWQYLLGTANALTPTKTTLKTTQKPHIDAGVIIKTSTSSSITFSSRNNDYDVDVKSISNNKKNNDSKHNNTNNEVTDSTSTATTTTTSTTTLTQQPQNTTITPKVTNTLQNTLKNVTLGFQKQFQYYMNLLQQHQQQQHQHHQKQNNIYNGSLSNSHSGPQFSNDSHNRTHKISGSSRSSSKFSSSSDNSHSSRGSSRKTLLATKYFTTTTISTTNQKTPKSITNSPNSNYSVTNNNQHGQHHSNNNNNNDGEDNHDNEDGNDNNNSNDDHVESNEAIDKQKRKFDVKFEQQRLQQQQQEQQSPTTPATIANVIPTARNIIFGGRTPTTTRNSNTFLEAYFRKLQTFNAPTAPAPAPPTSTTTIATDKTPTLTTTATNAQAPTIKLLATTTTSSTSSTSSSTNNNSRKQLQQQQKQFDKFAGHFLKRTPFPINNRMSSSNSSSSTITISNNINKNHNRFNNQHHQKQPQQQPQQQEQQHENDFDEISNEKTTQQPAYVTNYIGDPTNHLPAIVVSEHEHEHENAAKATVLDSLNLPTTLTTTRATQLQHQNQTPTQQKQQKIKTQKLIRRQLLRTQIK